MKAALIVVRVVVATLLGFCVVGALACVMGCHDTAPAVDAANAQREVGHASAAKLHALCTVPYEQAQTEADIQRLNDIGCPEAAFALRALRTSHALVVATLLAYDAGRCTSVVNQAPRECDIAGATLSMVKAAQDLAVAMRSLERAR